MSLEWYIYNEIKQKMNHHIMKYCILLNQKNKKYKNNTKIKCIVSICLIKGLIC